MALTIIFASLAIFLFVMAYIAYYRSKKAPATMIAQTENEQDFLAAISKRKQKSLARQPWSMKYSTYKTVALVSAIAFASIGYFTTHSILLMLLLSCLGLFVPEVIVRVKSSSSKAEFEERYATSLKQLVAGIKSGLSVHQAVENVCTSPFIHDSIKKEYKLLNADLKLGLPIHEAFERFAERIDSDDAKDVAIAMRMQANVGGRESLTIEAVSKNISERIMLRKEIKTMFAGSNMTVLAMDFSPYLIVLFMYVSVPGYLTPFFESSSMLLIFIALLVFMGVGSIFVHNKITRMKKECGIL